MTNVANAEPISRRCAERGGREHRLHAEGSESGDSQAGNNYVKAEWRCPNCRVIRVEVSTSTWVSAGVKSTDSNDQ